jgi:hypothetical protein
MLCTVPYCARRVGTRKRLSCWECCPTETTQGCLMIPYSAIYAMPDLKGIPAQEQKEGGQEFSGEKGNSARASSIGNTISFPLPPASRLLKTPPLWILIVCLVVSRQPVPKESLSLLQIGWVSDRIYFLYSTSEWVIPLNPFLSTCSVRRPSLD